MSVLIEIDYPAAAETIALGHYTVRVGASEPLVEAEVSIDRGPWRPCRHACGMWWYDWTGYSPGPHQIAARGISRSGEHANSTLRRFNAAAK